jgi:hypothetical protein
MLFGGRQLCAQTAFRGLFAVCPHNKKQANNSRSTAGRQDSMEKSSTYCFPRRICIILPLTTKSNI